MPEPFGDFGYNKPNIFNKDIIRFIFETINKFPKKKMGKLKNKSYLLRI